MNRSETMHPSHSAASPTQADDGATPKTNARTGAISLPEYARMHTSAGWRTYRGSAGTWWVQYEPGTMVRLPLFALHHPAPAELRRLQWIRLAPLLSYLVQPDAQHLYDSYLYSCTDASYCLENLEHRVRTNVKRGLREFQIRYLSAEELARGGFAAYRDTWHRHGRTGVTQAEFVNHYCATAALPGNRFLGAWNGAELAAYMGVAEVDDWVDVRSRYSTDDSLPRRPNDALLFTLLQQCLATRGFRLVSAGTSSIDPAANTPGLHRFKLKMGFQAVPVRRLFCFHALLRPLVSKPGLRVVERAAKAFPQTRSVKLAHHVLQHILLPPDYSLKPLQESAGNGLHF